MKHQITGIRLAPIAAIEKKETQWKRQKNNVTKTN